MLPDYARCPLKQGECGCLTVASPTQGGHHAGAGYQLGRHVRHHHRGAGIVSHASVVLLRELAHRLKLTRALGWH
jgi:hypothetical protein